MSAPASVVRYVELANRFDTYAVHAGPEPALPLLGYVRHDADSGNWIARTTGSDVDAASIRRGFRDRFAAASWLQRTARVFVAMLCIAPLTAVAQKPSPAWVSPPPEVRPHLMIEQPTNETVRLLAQQRETQTLILQTLLRMYAAQQVPACASQSDPRELVR